MTKTAHFDEEAEWNLPTELRPALRQLLLAHHYSGDVKIAPWQFAVPIGSLHACGLAENDVRWLLSKCFADHRSETTMVGEAVRSFRPQTGATFTEVSCFVLTFTGVAFAETFLSETNRSPTNGRNGKSRSNGRSRKERPAGKRQAQQVGVAVQRPDWDADSRELRLGEALVKRFVVPAPCQTRLLDAFQEDSWIEQIDDPLPQPPNGDAKERLRNTVKALNRNQTDNVLRFAIAGSGEAVRWALNPGPSGQQVE